MKSGKYLELENNLYNWIVQMREKQKNLPGFLICEKATLIAEELGITDFQCSKGWFSNFKKRFSLKNYKMHGEAGSADVSSIYNWINDNKITINQYQEKDILNLDETALFYEQVSQKTYATKDENLKGCKQSKKRVTVLVTASLTGEKFPIYVIGKYKKPRCFKGINELPVNYLSQKNGWMTAALFFQILKNLNQKFIVENRNVLILLDQCPSHPKLVETFSNIHLLFLPKNTTSVAQPMDLGVIHSLKSKYRQILSRQLLLNDNENNIKYTILDCIITLKKAWDMVTPTTIMNCFKKSIIFQGNL